MWLTNWTIIIMTLQHSKWYIRYFFIVYNYMQSRPGHPSWHLGHIGEKRAPNCEFLKGWISVNILSNNKRTVESSNSSTQIFVTSVSEMDLSTAEVSSVFENLRSNDVFRLVIIIDDTDDHITKVVSTPAVDCIKFWHTMCTTKWLLMLVHWKIHITFTSAASVSRNHDSMKNKRVIGYFNTATLTVSDERLQGQPQQ